MNIVKRTNVNSHKAYFVKASLVAVLTLNISLPLISSLPMIPHSFMTVDAQPKKEKLLEINAKDAELSQIIRIFSKRGKRNFILDERVRGKVTIYLPGYIDPETEAKILDSVLALKGFTTVPIGPNLWKVVPATDARKSTIPFRSGDDSSVLTGAVVSTIIPLRHVDASEVQAMVNQFTSPAGTAMVYQGSNSIVLVDHDTNVERIRKFINEVDIPYADREMTIIPVVHAEAADIAEKLSELLTDGKNKNSSTGKVIPVSNNNRRTTKLNRSGNTASAGGARRREPKILADERTNSLIIVADLETTAKIRALVDQLDSKVDRSGNRFFVYRCQHASAATLAEVMSGLVSGNSASNSSSSSSSRNQNNPNSRSQSRLANQRRVPGTSRRGNNQNGSSVSSVQFSDSTSITADPDTNSLIISSSETEYQKILSLLKELDIKRRQVLVEAMLLEVRVDESTAVGVDWSSSGGGADGGVIASSNFNGGIQSIINNPASLNNFTVAAASAGSISLPGVTLPSQSILLNAAQTNSRLNVLSAPTLLATDNEEAEIVVGNNVPFLASTSSNNTNLNNTFNQIDRQDVGITLRITPQINSNDFVSLKIFTDVSSIVQSANTELGPTTSVRSSETSIITKDSQMIVIGGLISDENTDSTDGVPFLKDIPILGEAFRRTTDERTRTNLLTFITPHIIRDQFDARDQTLVKRDKLSKTIRQEKASPSRAEVLQSQEIDNVSEVNTAKFKAPEPIRVPLSLDGQTDQSPAESTSSKIPANTEGNLGYGATRNLDVASEENLQPPKFKKDSTRKPLQPKVEDINATVPNTYANSSFRLLKLKSLPSAEILNQLPFTVSSNGYTGISLPESVSAKVSDTFEVGKDLSYTIGGKPIVLTVVDSSQSEVESIYPLSAFEILNIDRGPWKTK